MAKAKTADGGDETPAAGARRVQANRFERQTVHQPRIGCWHGKVSVHFVDPRDVGHETTCDRS
jgi:hypothetical protein